MDRKYIHILFDSRSAKKNADDLDKSVGNIGKSADDSQFAVNKLAAAISGIISAGAIAAFFAESIQASRKFQKTISELSAITGAAGKDLQFLTNASKELSKESTASANEVAEAFKLVASAKPDLLENAEALKAVTKQVIALSEAGSIDLAEAANVVGVSLNQFGEDASEAARYVNVLAAGAKYGSSEIFETAVAIKNAGVAAKNAKVSFEQTNAAIQVLGANGIKAGEAGTSLRNVITILETSTDKKLKPSINGLAGALEELNKRQLTATQYADMFGRENISAGLILSKNVDMFKNLEKSITGTNVAYEQQLTINDNLDSDLKKLQNNFETLKITIGDLFNADVRGSIQGFNDSIVTITDSMPEIIDGLEFMTALLIARFAPAIALSTIRFVALNLAQLRGTVTMGAYGNVIARTTVASNAMNASLRLLNGTMALLGGPLGIIALVATALIYFSDEADSAQKSASLLAETTEDLTDAQARNLQNKIAENIANQRQEMEKLQKQLDKMQNGQVRSGGAGSTRGGSKSKVIEFDQKDYDEVQSKIDTISKSIDELNKKSVEINIRNLPTVEQMTELSRIMLADFNKSNQKSETTETESESEKKKRLQREKDIQQAEENFTREMVGANNVTKSLQLELETRLTVSDAFRKANEIGVESGYLREAALLDASLLEKRTLVNQRATEDMVARQEQLRAALEIENLDKEQKALLEEMYRLQQLEANKVFEEQMTAITLEGEDARAKLRKAKMEEAYNVVIGLGEQIMSASQGQSKRAFELSKKGALASAAIDGGRSALSAWRSGMETPGPWAPLIAAAYTASSLLKTGSMINRIRGMSYGSSSSSSASSPAPTPAASPTDAGGGGPAGNFTLSGYNANSLYTGETLKAVGTALQEWWKNGGGDGKMIYKEST